MSFRRFFRPAFSSVFRLSSGFAFGSLSACAFCVPETDVSRGRPVFSPREKQQGEEGDDVGEEEKDPEQPSGDRVIEYVVKSRAEEDVEEQGGVEDDGGEHPLLRPDRRVKQYTHDCRIKA